LITTTIVEYIQEQLELLGEDIALSSAATDTVRTLEGLRANVVIKWLDPMTFDDSVDAPRFGANADFNAFFGDGWEGTPIYGGSSSAGYLWTNFEYVSGNAADLGAAPDDHQLNLARFLRDRGVLEIDPSDDAAWEQTEVDLSVDWHKKQMGGGWLRIVKDPATGEWAPDLAAADNKRFDATSATQLLVTGMTLSATAHDDDGNALPAGVVPGLQGNCSGGQTPWGTVITAEENVQGYYGDLEPWWTSQQAFIPGQGADSGAAIAFDFSPTASGDFGRSSNPNALQQRDYYSFVSEIDPTAAADEYYGKNTAGVGHQKIGAIGRGHWENVAIAVNTDFELVDDQPIVMYAGDDRRSGRIYKFVSEDDWTSDMTRAETRDLLTSGDLYVAHFADLFNAGTGLTIGSGDTPTEEEPGNGVWIHLSTSNTDQDAPNAAALGAGTKVGAALTSNTWNGMGGFASQNDVLRALFTASAKIGIRELNRPEDIEWNPFDKKIYLAFTNHSRRVALDEDGVLFDPATHATESPLRDDPLGAVFVMEEGDPDDPGASLAFTFYSAWNGTSGQGPLDAANPDNVMIDPQGNVWFGTDGNFGTNGTADAIYYLDREEGRAIRVVAAPSNAEATGPALTPDGKTLFFNVQHPGEGQFSSWPNGSAYGPLSALVAVTVAP
jgi:secreted PhoX family phosphatase